MLIASKFGMNITLLIPDEAYQLDERFMDAAHYQAEHAGGSIEVTGNIEKAYSWCGICLCQELGRFAAVWPTGRGSAAARTVFVISWWMRPRWP